MGRDNDEAARPTIVAAGKPKTNVSLATSEQWESIVRRMEQLYTEMGTRRVRDGRHLVYEPS